MELDFTTPQICVFLGKPKKGKSYALRHTILKNTIQWCRAYNVGCYSAKLNFEKSKFTSQRML